MRITDKSKVYILSILCTLLIACKSSNETATENDPLSGFYGTFTGNAESVLSGEVSERELTVVIKPQEETGFTVEWTTLIHRANGKKKMSDLSIDFYPSARPGIFASAMRTDVFGRAVPYDPVGEDAHPYVWAGFEGSTLTIRALYIVEGGGYEMHVYERSLNEEGLKLDFERLRNGDTVAQVSAQLELVE